MGRGRKATATGRGHGSPSLREYFQQQPAPTDAKKRPAAAPGAHSAVPGTDAAASPKSPPKRQKAGNATAMQASLLHKFAEAQLGVFKKAEVECMRSVLRALSMGTGRLKVASACTGTDIAFFAAAIVVSILTKGKGVVQNVFGCESDERKQRFLNERVLQHPWGAHAAHGPCLFKDICRLGACKAPCVAHHLKAGCLVPSGGRGPTVVAAGFSCKTFSPMNNNRGQVPGALGNRATSTGKTFQGLTKYTDEHQPPVLIMENVPEILNPAQEHLGAMRAVFDAQGYELVSLKVDAGRQGSPVPRGRAYFLALHRRKLGLSAADARAASQRAQEVMERLQQIAPIASFSDLLLPLGHPLVQQELKHLQEVTGGGADDTDTAWQTVLAQQLADAKLPHSAVQPPEKARASPFFGVLTKRAQAILGFNMARHPDDPAYELCMSSTRYSSSPPVERDTSRMARTLIPRSLVWVNTPNQQRLLTGWEHMLLQGMPMHAVDKDGATSRAILVDLAGNAFNGASIVAALLCLLAALPCGFVMAAEDLQPEGAELLPAEIMDSALGAFAVQGSSDEEVSLPSPAGPLRYPQRR